MHSQPKKLNLSSRDETVVSSRSYTIAKQHQRRDFDKLWLLGFFTQLLSSALRKSCFCAYNVYSSLRNIKM